jgi:flagellar secretion chaperone FliS
MFSSLHTGTYGSPNAFANAYRRIGVATSVESASPHRLITLLFDGYMEALATARGALREGRIEAKGKAISRAARIVDEGLKAGLNLQDGGRLAADLKSLYEYLTLRLTLANVRNDDKILEECIGLVEPLRQAWREIGPRVDTESVN